MNMELLQGMIDVVFKGNLVLLSPVLFFLMAVLFADRLVDLIYRAFGRDSGGRRSR